MPAHPKRTKEAVLSAIKNRKGKIYLVAADLKVTSHTVQNYAQRWPEVREAIEEAKGHMLDRAEHKLYEAIEKGEAWAICFFLKTQGKARGFIERQEFRHGGDENAPPIKSEVLGSLLKTERGGTLLANIAEEMAAQRKGEPIQNGDPTKDQEIEGNGSGPGA